MSTVDGLVFWSIMVGELRTFGGDLNSDTNTHRYSDSTETASRALIFSGCISLLVAVHWDTLQGHVIPTQTSDIILLMTSKCQARLF